MSTSKYEIRYAYTVKVIGQMLYEVGMTTDRKILHIYEYCKNSKSKLPPTDVELYLM